jgi:acetyl-CoA carboxylase, biotin carboxylase subunit
MAQRSSRRSDVIHGLPMFRRILIANRGEVAARVARTCRRLGVEVVVVASAADISQKWLATVDRVVALGPARAQFSYLDQDALLEVARATGCGAIHPGWGFLSENDVFAARCEGMGIAFIGPKPQHMRWMGDKAAARKTMQRLGMPVIPGSDGPVGDAHTARQLANSMGYPVLLKAVAGGGGRGMRAVASESELDAAFDAASAEALAAFSDDRLYLEKLILGGRHVEVQLLSDAYGRCLQLGERECSVQRRHQKVLEESPSPGLTASERTRVLPLVADVVSRLGYRGAGTVEMLLDADGKLWFMEMNTRLQVEHSITEARCGVDLVEWQLRIAANEALPEQLPQPVGFAMECRINAEDPDQGFRPSPGLVFDLQLPEGEGIRVDTHLSSGDRIPPNYDSMVAKIIVHADTRDAAIQRMREALASTRVEGVATNIGLHQRILNWPTFMSGDYNTTSLETWMQDGTP